VHEAVSEIEMATAALLKVGIMGMLSRVRMLFCTLAISALLVPGCSPARDPNNDVLKLGAYSVVKEVLGDGLLPAFKAAWKKKTGRTLEFEVAYNASGAQARAIQSGYDADVAILSHEGDMDLLARSGRVKSTWKEGPYRGMITHSLVVIGHRPGNPKMIKDWSDLAKPSVAVLYPDPKTSGGARWNINAIYGSAYLASREANGGKADLRSVQDFLAKVQANVVNMDQSGRQSMANFAERGTGDAVVTYENELLLLKKEKEAIPYVIPAATLLIESPAAIVEPSVDSHGSRAVAEAFLEFVRSDEGQRIVAAYGFRPVKGDVELPSGLPALPEKLFTMADLGGWEKLEKELYGNDGIWTSIFASLSSARAAGR
jgi:sulfate/thiosulfate transport system substrate-binding protein